MMRSEQNYDGFSAPFDPALSGGGGYSDPYQSPPYIPPYDSGGGNGVYFSDPYVNPDGSTGGIDTGLQLAPGQNYTPGRARQTFSNYFGSAPAFSRGGYPSPSQSGVSYIGPTVSARPAFNLRMRGLRVKDVFKRRLFL